MSCQKNNLEFTEEDYELLKNNDSNKYKGFASFAYSFGSKFLGGWSRNSKGCDYVKRAFLNAVKQSPNLQGVELVNCHYLELEIPSNSIIYCDPPYKGTTSYKTEKFNHVKFWQWCRDKVKNGHIVFISEYNAPSDFKCVWQGEVKTNFSYQREKASHNAIEKLFKYDL